MNDRLRLIAKSLGEDRVRFNEDLSQHTYFKSAVVADCFYIVTSTQEFLMILDLAYELKIPYTILGAGTKFNFKSKQIQGLVIKNRTSNIKIAGIKGKVDKRGIGIQEALVTVDSGVSVSKLNVYLSAQGLKDITGYSSIYSTIGGAMFIDAGFQELAEKVTIWSQGIISEISIKELSIKSDVVISAIFKMKAK